jgi:hypothetical protein
VPADEANAATDEEVWGKEASRDEDEDEEEEECAAAAFADAEAAAMLALNTAACVASDAPWWTALTAATDAIAHSGLCDRRLCALRPAKIPELSPKTGAAPRDRSRPGWKPLGANPALSLTISQRSPRPPPFSFQNLIPSAGMRAHPFLSHVPLFACTRLSFIFAFVSFEPAPLGIFLPRGTHFQDFCFAFKPHAVSLYFSHWFVQTACTHTFSLLILSFPAFRSCRKRLSIPRNTTTTSSSTGAHLMRPRPITRSHHLLPVSALHLDDRYSHAYHCYTQMHFLTISVTSSCPRSLPRPCAASACWPRPSGAALVRAQSAIHCHFTRIF